MKREHFRKPSFILWTTLLLALLWLPIQMQTYTLEAIMSYAFPSGLVVSPRGDRVAWVFNSKGIRNMWIAEGPQYKAQPLTSYSLDDGQELGQFSFSADGSIIVFVRGGDTNRSGEYPNPTSNPKGVEQTVWAIKADGGEPWRIGNGSNPIPSPVNNQLIFVARGEVYIAALEGKPEAKPLFKARGRNGSPTWSPDGSPDREEAPYSPRGYSF